MNTVQKGDVFENKVYAMLKGLIESDQLAIDRKSYRIFQKKGYYSKTQESEIIFDISIEVFMPNAEDYSLLWLIECKDQTSPIPVSKVRNFNEQVREVGGHKALFVTSNKYQSGAVNIAKSNKMGLIILNKDNSPDWIVRRSINADRYSLSKSEAYFSGNGIVDTPSIAYDYPMVYGNIIDFFSGNGIEVKTKGMRVPYLDDETIAVKAMEAAELDKGNHVFKMSSSDITNLISDKYGVQIVLNAELRDGELARYDIPNNTIQIAKSLDFDSPRWRFTVAHESGHIVLHKELLQSHQIEELCDDDNIVASNDITDSLMDQEYKRLEIQANKFASCFLMPMLPLAYHFTLSKDRNNIRLPWLFLDDQPCNIADCENVFSDLSAIFGVSKESIKYRLINVKFCKEGRRADKIGNLIRRL